MDVMIKIAKKPFEKGNFLQTSRCIIESPFKKTDNTSQTMHVYYSHDIFQKNFIVKQAQKTPLTRKDCEYYLFMIKEAQFYSKKFNELLQSIYNNINTNINTNIEQCYLTYVNSYLATIKPTNENESYEYMIIEQELVGKYEKYNNNTGNCAPSPTNYGTNHDIVQAFCHWTYCFTQGQMMAVDAQGVYYQEQKTFVLTDPIFHTLQYNSFKFCEFYVDGSKKYMDLFLYSHKCNKYCEILNIKNKK